MTKSSYTIDNQSGNEMLSKQTEALHHLAKNQILFDFEALEPFAERIKLEGDEYDTGNRRLNKKDAAAGATLEIYRSLDSIEL